MTNRARILAFVLGAFAGVSTASPKLLAAQGAATGAIEGRVIETENSRPVAGAQIIVSGTSIRATTNDAGTFRIAGVPARQVELRVRAIGFAPATQTVVVAAAQTVRADFKVAVSALQLDQVVVTGSGQQVEVKKLGNTVAVIQPPQNTPMNDISAILQAREPGLTAISSAGLTGTGARIRIRGNASLTQSNEPVIFLDGIRINSGGGQTSRLEDIDPESIERIEVLKGAARRRSMERSVERCHSSFTKRGSNSATRWHFPQRGSDPAPDRVAPNAGYAKTQAQADSLAAYWHIAG
jgi:hypothetical protein